MSTNNTTACTEIKLAFQNAERMSRDRSKRLSRHSLNDIECCEDFTRPTDLDETKFDWHFNEPRCVLLNEKTVERYRKNILLNKRNEDLTVNVNHNTNSTKPGKVGNWSDRIRKHYLCQCHGLNPCPF